MRSIDADALRERFLVLRSNVTNVQCISDIFDICLTEVSNAPTIELKDVYQEGHYDGHLEGYTKAINEERPRGEWISIGYGYSCSICHNYHENSNFCPNCGADMRGVK